MAVFEDVYQELSKEQIMVSSYNDTFWEGSITLSEKSKVLVTVPTAKGYSVYVDGKIADYEEYNDEFDDEEDDDEDFEKDFEDEIIEEGADF